MATEAARASSTTIREKEPAGADQVRLVLDAPPGFLDAYVRPGQYAELGTKGGERAPYALLSAPHERLLAFLVKTTSEPGATLAHLAVGDLVDVTAPSGPGFDLDAACGKDLVFVATGTGIAPIRAAIETALRRRGDFGALALYYGVRDDRFVSVARALRRWELAGVALRVHHSRPADARSTDVYVQHLVAEDAPDPARARFVVAGHDALVDAIVAYVVGHGGQARDVLRNF
jgi:CDP-4-dehydro-6-deoxyglucose reductase